ncbi:MAG: DUF3298 domain-containing protein [Niabella sp.]
MEIINNKNMLLNKIIGSAAISLLLCSSSFIYAQKADTLSYHYLSVSDSARAFDKDESPEAQVESNFPVFEEKLSHGKWMNIRVKKLLDLDTTSSFENGIVTSQKQYLEDYKKGMKGNENNGSASMNYMNTTEVEVSYNHKDFLVLSTTRYDYSGGAHGNHGTYHVCYDVLHRNVLMLQDIIKADSATLQKLVEAQFRTDNELQPEDSLNTILFENYLPANNNFFINDKGLGFTYNPYEVAAYAFGTIDVLIPYQKLKQYLIPAFKRQMKIR